MQGELTFANTVEQFDPGDCDGGVVEVLESQEMINKVYSAIGEVASEKNASILLPIPPVGVWDGCNAGDGVE
ncbi:hypothetical protein [Tunturiibacter gelidiferens]|uniref:hypothetical protein n=1 Tax=Tunturiibacter gelidiferens TaxID=3069689 RepID=UPI003D9BFCFC